MHHLGRLKLLGAVFGIVGGLYYYATVPEAPDGPRTYYPAATRTPALERAARQAANDAREEMNGMTADPTADGGAAAG